VIEDLQTIAREAEYTLDDFGEISHELATATSSFRLEHERCNMQAGCYLIHFSRRLHHAGHYIGFTTNFPRRMQEHRNNTGAKLLRALNIVGIVWKVVRVWPGVSNEFEYDLKALKKGPSLCPVCNPESKSKLLRGSEAIQK
jgi:predicted GIY-YIG superfamily endonuclease